MKFLIALIIVAICYFAVFVQATDYDEFSQLPADKVETCLKEADIKTSGIKVPSLLKQISEQVDEKILYNEEEIGTKILRLLEDDESLTQFLKDCHEFGKPINEILYDGACGNGFGYALDLYGDNRERILVNHQVLKELIDLNDLCFVVSIRQNPANGRYE